MFCEGQLKAGGQREETGRQKKRPHLALLVPGNHFLPAVFSKEEHFEQEDGQLTGVEVTTKLVVLPIVLAAMHIDLAEWHINVTFKTWKCMKVRDFILFIF